MKKTTTDLDEIVIDQTRYTWGHIICIYEMGRYNVVQYMQRREPNQTHDESEEETLKRMKYHPYVDGEDTNTSCNTLEEALIHAIARGKLEVNEARAMTRACVKILGLGEQS